MTLSQFLKITGMFAYLGAELTGITFADSEIVSKINSKSFEHSSYRVLYRPTSRQKVLDTHESKASILEEVIYKVSLLDAKESLGPMKAGCAEIRFLDSNNYIVSSDLILQDQLLPKREYYNYLWIPKDKLESIHDIRLKILAPHEISAAQTRVQLNGRLRGENNGGDRPIVMPKLNPDISAASDAPVIDNELNRKEKLSIIDQNIQKIQTMLGRPEQSSALPLSDSEKNALVAPDSPEAAMERITNDDLSKFLKEIDSQAPTISESETASESGPDIHEEA